MYKYEYNGLKLLLLIKELNFDHVLQGKLILLAPKTVNKTIFILIY